MQASIRHRYSWFFVLLGLVCLNIGMYFVSYQIDCTEDNKYTLSKASQTLLASLDEPVYLTVLLEGDLPSEFKKIKNSIQDLLTEMNPYAHHKLFYKFVNPMDILNDSTKSRFLDTLYALGLRPTQINKANKQKGEGMQKTVFPSAIMKYKNRLIGVPFLSETLLNTVRSLNNAEALLEYKLTSALEKITQNKKISIAYATGHGEALGYEVLDLFRSLSLHYLLDTFSLSTKAFINPQEYDLLLIVKPTLTFSDKDKLKIDQYILRGGKVFFLLDPVYAEMSFLQKNKTFVAQNLSLGLDDLLFHYGVQLEYNLLQDLQADRLPIQVGWNGDKPQFELLSWYYAPLLKPNHEHVITKNLDLVLAQFASTLTLTQNPHSTKQVLLSSSEQSRKVGTPHLVSFDILKQNPSPQVFNQSFLPVAVLVKGIFKSLYANRLTESLRKEYEASSGESILTEAPSERSLIIASDADLVVNAITQKEGPLEMGTNPYTGFQFANKVFLQNAVEYLCSPTGIIENRNKDFTLRLLNRKKIEQEKTFWQMCTLIVPLFSTIVAYLVYVVIRWRTYTK